MGRITFPLNGDDDYIGSESCIDLQNPNDAVDDHDTSKYNYLGNEGEGKSNNNMKKKENKVFPPPIPLLARTQNLASHMPWVLKRYYTSEGRLILREEKVRHHEYFHAHRANGRLTLQLVNVPLHDHDDYFEEAAPTSPHQEVLDIHDVTREDNSVSTGSNSHHKFEDEENVDSGITDDADVVAGCGRVKCLNCNGERSAPPRIQ
ncbi:hypothetical protein CR513_37474, partial [Mucuna pruriens]